MDVDINKVANNISAILRGLKVRHTKVTPELRYTFGGGSEVVFRVDNAVIGDVRLTKLSYVYMSNGDVVGNASSSTRKHLITVPRIGKITTLSKLTQRNGLLKDILEWSVGEIKDQADEI